MIHLRNERLARERLTSVKGVMFDIDGCLILSDFPGGHQGVVLSGAAEAIAHVRRLGLPLVVFTNGSMQTPAQIGAALRFMGIDVRDEEVLTPAVVAAELVRRRHPGEEILVFGAEGVFEVFHQSGIAVIDSQTALRRGPVATPLVVIGWDCEFNRDKLQVAAEAIRAGAGVLATSDSPQYASRSRINVGVTGFIAAGLRHVTGRDYEVAGKPSRAAMETISAHLGVAPDEILVVGDDLELECGMAVRAGALSVLVTTGTNTALDAESADDSCRPEIVVDSLDELVALWCGVGLAAVVN
jgi:HAD superfamily hydrolase (TIGR01450 family)